MPLHGPQGHGATLRPAEAEHAPTDALRVYLDEGRLEGQLPITPGLPEREAEPLRRRLRAALSTSEARADSAHAAHATTRQQVDASVQAACLAAMASLLADCAAPEFLPVQVASAPRPATFDALDLETHRLMDRFVQRQPTSSRAFGRLLRDTSHFKTFMEHVAKPRAHWPRWLRFFAAHAAHAHAMHVQ